jgi:RsiW-degrading membrane proteinase PrsW (M82 family)
VYFVFGVLLAIAIGVAVAQEYFRDRLRSRKTIAVLAASTLAGGVLLGWALTLFMAWLEFARTTRGY